MYDEDAKAVHATAVDKGFWPAKYYVEYKDGEICLGAKRVTEEAICTKLALVHSEVTEVLEAVRKNKGAYEVVEEMADTIIRTLDLYQALCETGQVEASLDEVMQTKMTKNSFRPRLHGNNF